MIGEIALGLKPRVYDSDLIDAYFLINHPGWNYDGSLLDTPERILVLINLIEQSRVKRGQ